jgi:hypothetical protein
VPTNYISAGDDVEDGFDEPWQLFLNPQCSTEGMSLSKQQDRF